MERNLQVEELLRQNPDFILALTQSHERTLEWLRHHNLLPSQLIGTCCNLQCNLVHDNQRLDGQEFRCPTRSCRKRYSIRTGTIWSPFRRTPLIVLVRIIFYFFTEQLSPRKAARRLNAAGYLIRLRTIQRMYRAVRNSIQRYMNQEVFSERLMGTIEIDEALFTHRAGPGRRGARQIWAISLVERRTRTAFAFVVQNRNSATINNLIQRYTTRGSLIVHDGWQGYHNIPRPWRHIDVNQDETYTTSQVEGLWGQLWPRIRNIYSGGVVAGNVEAVLTEVLWRRNVDFANRDLQEQLIYVLSHYS